MSGLPKEVHQAVKSFNKALTSIEEQLNNYFKFPLTSTLENLAEEERAKLYIAIAYAVNTLFYMYLKTQGQPTNDHPVKGELERIKLKIKELKELSDKKNGREQKATMRLNVDAAQRFINHGIGAPIKTNSSEGDENVDRSNTPKDKSNSRKDNNSEKKISPQKRERSGSSETSKQTPKEDMKRRRQ